MTEEQAQKLGQYQCCRKGLKPESPNQDNFLVSEFEHWRLIGVFDGHGPQGHDVSDQIARNLSRIIQEKLVTDKETSDMTKMLKASFHKVQEEMVSQCNKTGEFDCALSGSTVTVALIDNKTRQVQVAHVGDSKSIVCINDSGKQKAKEITIDHKPTLPQEKKRILEKGGEVKKLEGDIPHRVFVKGRQFPGLAMSRACGDLIANSVGVSCDPDVATFEINNTWDQLLLCSDGVWEFINAKTVCSTVQHNEKDLKKACVEIAQQSWKRWIHNEENVVDDITAMIFNLKVMRN